jgi:hypothetical protein
MLKTQLMRSESRKNVSVSSVVNVFLLRVHYRPATHLIAAIICDWNLASLHVAGK